MIVGISFYAVVLPHSLKLLSRYLLLYIRDRSDKYRHRGFVVEDHIYERSVERDDLHFVELYRCFVDCNC